MLGIIGNLRRDVRPIVVLLHLNSARFATIDAKQRRRENGARRDHFETHSKLAIWRWWTSQSAGGGVRDAGYWTVSGMNQYHLKLEWHFDPKNAISQALELVRPASSVTTAPFVFNDLEKRENPKTPSGDCHSC